MYLELVCRATDEFHQALYKLKALVRCCTVPKSYQRGHAYFRVGLGIVLAQELFLRINRFLVQNGSNSGGNSFLCLDKSQAKKCVFNIEILQLRLI